MQTVAYRDICAKCGARRIDTQIGIELTPDAYVATLVAVFREVRRVLKDDGTAWLNLGDSYAGSWKNQGREKDRGTQRPINGPMMQSFSGHPAPVSNAGVVPDGLKPKDLVGIPWRVAFALQQPYYTGRIKSVEDRIWLAAMLDAEGCLFIHKRKAGQPNGQGYFRQNDSYGPGVEISNTSCAVVERIAALVGLGSICSQGPDENGRRRQKLYRWNLRTTECREFVRECYPHLVTKKQQARILIGCPSSGERAEAAHAALIALHRTGESSVDFPAPSSLYEPGYYLRSDVIWSKSNPTPESVMDRPTKAHEYVFLLSKSARYYYDAAAIAEPVSDAMLQKIEQGYNGTATKDYEGAGVQNPSAVKARILDKQRQLGKRTYAGFNDRWDRKIEEYSGKRAGTDSQAPGRRMLKNVAEARAAGADHDSPFGPTRNARTVWTITTQPFKGAHFATFPEALAERCVKAGSREGDTVLDPFTGSGTVGQVCRSLGREFVGIGLNETYLELARVRIESPTRAEKVALKRPRKTRPVVEVEPLLPFEEPLDPQPLV